MRLEDSSPASLNAAVTCKCDRPLSDAKEVNFSIGKTKSYGVKGRKTDVFFRTSTGSIQRYADKRQSNVTQ